MILGVCSTQGDVRSTRKSWWSELPSDLLELILPRLVLNDYLKCRLVCRSWANIINNVKYRCHPIPQFPLLMRLPRSPPNANRLDSAIVLDITQNTVHTLQTHSWEGDFEFVYSQDGWMLFQNPSYYIVGQLCSLFWLFNPVSGEKHQLPPLPLTFSGRKYSTLVSHHNRATLSFASDPQNFMVAVSSCARIGQDKIMQLSFCKVTDGSWTLIETRGRLHNIGLIGWKLYAINLAELDLLTIYDLRNPDAITVERLVLPPPTLTVVFTQKRFKGQLEYYKDGYMPMMAIDSARGEVLLVFCRSDGTVCRSDTKKHSISVIRFRIFKLDMSDPEWIEVDSLGDRILLINSMGENIIHVISTAEINGPPELTDCVLFNVRNTLDSFGECNLAVFSLKYKTIKPLPLIVPNFQAYGRCLWFSPLP